MPLTYIPPKNMVTEEFIGNPSPQGNVFLKPVIMGPKYKVHYKDLVDSSTVAYSTNLTMDVPSKSDITAGNTLLYGGDTFKLYGTGSTQTYELKQTPWGVTDADIALAVTGVLTISSYDTAKERIAVAYSSEISDWDADVRDGVRYMKVVSDTYATDGTGQCKYEYYDANVNFSTLLPDYKNHDFNFAIGTGTSSSGTLTEKDGRTTGSDYIHITKVEGSKIQFTVPYDASATTDMIYRTTRTKGLDAGYVLTAADMTDADTKKVITYIQVAYSMPAGGDVATDMPFHISYRELDKSLGDKVYTITYPEITTYFPVDTIADKLGKMVYTAFQSGATTVNFYALPYDDEVDGAWDATDFQNALTTIGESDSYFIVNYDYNTASHPYITDFIAQYAAETVSKPMTAILSYRLPTGSTYQNYLDGGDSTLYDMANAINTYAQGLDNRRIVLIWPEVVAMYSGNAAYDDEFGYLINDSTFGHVVEGCGAYAAAAYAGYRASQPPQQGLSNGIVKGLVYVKESSDVFPKTLPDQPLNIIASGGVTVLFQEFPTSYVTVYHQLSTDVSAVEKKEFNKTVCYDYAAYYLLSISPKRGRKNWTNPVIGYELGLMTAGCKQLVKAGILTYAKVGTPTLEGDELTIPIVVESPTPDNYKVINLQIRG